ncbi:MAG: MFS transporter [Myxococcota bacterium]|nr:MFS transporter [Myxococcota bacterium]MEC8422227.1 MFS transporter [Myxococcota bacterium]
MFRALLPVLMTVFLDLIGFGIVIPLLPFYAEEYGASAAEVTWLMAAYSLAQFFFAPLWGSASDRFGRRPVLLASILMTAVGLAGFAAAESLAGLFLFRILHGAMTANISTAQAAVADITPPEKRAMGMGLIGAAFGVGFTVGPFVGGELTAPSIAAAVSDLLGGVAVNRYAVPIWVAAAMSVANLAMTAVLLPETRHPGSTTRPRPLSPTAFLKVLRHPVVGLCVLLTFVLTVSFAMMESTFTLFAEHARGLDAPEVGRMFGVAGVVMILVQGGLIRPLVKRFGEGPLVPIGIGILAVGLALLPFAPPVGPMVAVFVWIAIGNGISSPSLQALISQGTSPAEQGFVLGTNQSMSALARAIGPTIGGLLYTGLGPSSPFLGAAAVLAVAVILAVAAVRQRTRALAAGG